MAEAGAKELRLWSRTWDRRWDVDVTWEDREEGKGEGDGGFGGKVVCLWSDANQPGSIPALDEVNKFKPVWVAVSKAADGLVEGERGFSV